MKVVITSATAKETEQIKRTFNTTVFKESQGLDVSFHESGVGLLSSCFSISQLIFEQHPDLIIQTGIAGTFDNSIEPGKVVVVKDELLGDLGVEENGCFKDLFDLNLISENLFPYNGRTLRNRFLGEYNISGLEEVTAITINEITTRPARIEALKVKYKAVIESMEGAINRSGILKILLII
jgi:futalosine hydrolase